MRNEKGLGSIPKHDPLSEMGWNSKGRFEVELVDVQIVRLELPFGGDYLQISLSRRVSLAITTYIFGLEGGYT